MTAILQTEAFILAGGKSSRMGSDKGLIEINGRPMTAHLIDTLQDLGIITSIISNNSDYQQFGLPVLPDIIKDQGPLGGLYTAMRWTRTTNVLLLSCDMPFLGSEAITTLLEAIQPGKIIAAQMNGRLNPMPAIYPSILEEKVKSLISEHKLQLCRWISEQNPVVVSLENGPKPDEGNNFSYFEERFVNLNTPEDIDNLNRKHYKAQDNPAQINN